MFLNWEYKILNLSAHPSDNDLMMLLYDMGLLGWDLVSIVQYDTSERYIFKRQIEVYK